MVGKLSQLGSTTKMKIVPARLAIFALLSITVAAGAKCWLFAGSKVPPQVAVYFAPGGEPTQAIVNALHQAKQAVLVQAYSFTSAPIAKALVEAHKRGVRTQVILDSSQQTEKYSEADFLAHAGIRCLIDGEHAIAHNKVMVIDGVTVITGSFNFTKAAEEKNAENVVIITDPSVASQYAANWRSHEKHSPKYVGR
jgi:phosphatidylserine/phosphatidylglycerophosphate/cardiolipin synthase-like enzyme